LPPSQASFYTWYAGTNKRYAKKQLNMG